MTSKELFKNGMIQKIKEDTENFREDIRYNFTSGWTQEDVWEEFEDSFGNLEDQISRLFYLTIEDEDEYEAINEVLEDEYDKAKKFFNSIAK